MKEAGPMKKNIATWERVARVLLGMALVVVGVVTFGASVAFAYRAFAIAGVVLGLDFMVTGAIGFCPLYYKLGWSTLAPRRVGL
jgi:Na+-transporting NADH:ubiquinone oxidoreductase subunit NqrB